MSPWGCLHSVLSHAFAFPHAQLLPWLQNLAWPAMIAHHDMHIHLMARSIRFCIQPVINIFSSQKEKGIIPKVLMPTFLKPRLEMSRQIFARLYCLPASATKIWQQTWVWRKLFTAWSVSMISRLLLVLTPAATPTPRLFTSNNTGADQPLCDEATCTRAGLWEAPFFHLHPFRSLAYLCGQFL